MVLHNVQLSLLSELKISHQLCLTISVLPCFPFSQFILPTSYHSKFRKHNTVYLIDITLWLVTACLCLEAYVSPSIVVVVR